MKKIILITLVAVLTSSCSALLPAQNPASNVDTQATIDSMVQISAEQTLAAQPSPTTVPPTDTATSVVASSPTIVAPVESPTEVPSSTPASNLTTTPATATSGPEQANVTATATQAVSGQPTLTPTLGILLYGTLPPAVPSAKVKLVNKSQTQVYISLQNYQPNKEPAILEYPVVGQVRIDAPLGPYLYVVWVGGRKIVGEFSLGNGDDITITIYRDKVEITD